MKQLQRSFMRTPIGHIEVNCTDNGISSLVFLDFRVKPQHVPACLRSCIDQLEEYFSGDRHTFDLPFDLSGTPFQQKVWSALMTIPFGRTITYHELAAITGNERAVRAVGRANSHNPVSIIIPCHRVIGSDGRLVGYRGGLKRKKWLLEHEHAFAQRDLFYGK